MRRSQTPCQSGFDSPARYQLGDDMTIFDVIVSVGLMLSYSCEVPAGETLTVPNSWTSVEVRAGVAARELKCSFGECEADTSPAVITGKEKVVPPAKGSRPAACVITAREIVPAAK